MTPRFPALRDRASGSLSITRQEVTFEDEEAPEKRVVIPLSKATIKMGGLNSHIFLIGHSFDKSISLATQDVQAIELLASYGVKQAQDILAHSRKRFTKKWATIGISISIVLGLLVGMPILLSWFPLSLLNRIVTVERERKLSNFFYGDKIKESKSGTNKAANDYLQSMVDYIKKSSPDVNGLSLEISVDPSSEVNAFALPGGYLIMNKGLIDKASSIEEVMGVIGHEIGHIDRRHYLKRFVGTMGFTLGLMTVNVFFGGVMAEGIANLTNLAGLKYSRDHEREADERSFDLIKNAKVNPNGFTSFLAKLAKEESSVGKFLGMLSTHPYPLERVADLETLIKRYPYQTANHPFKLTELKKRLNERTTP